MKGSSSETRRSIEDSAGSAARSGGWLGHCTRAWRYLISMWFVTSTTLVRLVTSSSAAALSASCLA